MTPADRAQLVLDSLPRGDVMAAACPSRAILQHLTSRWGVLVMAVLATGTHRFAQLRRRIGGVSERMLAQTLQDLAGDGLVERIEHAVVPPHVDYRLTPAGRQAAEHLVALVGWIEGNLPALLAARSARPEADAPPEPVQPEPVPFIPSSAGRSGPASGP